MVRGKFVPPTIQTSVTFRDFAHALNVSPYNLASFLQGSYPFLNKKFKDFSRSFKDIFRIFQGLHSVQKRALSICLLLVLQHQEIFVFAPFPFQFS